MGELEYWDINFEQLKERIKEDTQLLKEPNIKRIVIDNFDLFNFSEFDSCAIKDLLDGDGLNLLMYRSSSGHKICSILKSNLSDVKELLFSNKKFCGMICENLGDWEIALSKWLDEKSAMLFMKYVIENEPDKTVYVFYHAIKDCFRFSIVKNLDIPFELVKAILTHRSMNNSKDSAMYLIENDTRITSLMLFTIEEIYLIARNVEKIPEHLLNDREFINRMASMESVKDYRIIISMLAMHNDVSLIEATRKKFYDREIASFNEEENMLSRYLQFYQELCNSMSPFAEDDYVGELIDKYFVFSKNSNTKRDSNVHGKMFKNDIYFYTSNMDRIGLRKYLERESHLQLTNMVIDYHYEDFLYNFFLDLKQLMKFHKDGFITLSSEDIDLYNSLLNMDDMSGDKVKAFHDKLKSYPVMAMNYDNFRTARDKAISLMNDAALNKDTIAKYKNSEMSDEYGVPVYVLDGEEFYAYVRGYSIFKNDSLLNNPIRHDVDRNSYSLVGSSRLDVYLDPRQRYNFIYLSPMPVDQVAHICSEPSFSYRYVRNVNAPSLYVNELCSPKELVKTGSSYTEVVLIVPNKNRNDELNERLVHPEIFGIYCYDEISENDISNAKEMGLSIVLVKTKSYGQYVPTYDPEKYLDSIEADDMGERRFR